jgi:hypothetical protein
MKELPSRLEKMKSKCFACGKPHSSPSHIICAGLVVHKQIVREHKGKRWVFRVCAPIGCWLKHNKKTVDAFYTDQDWFGWRWNEQDEIDGLIEHLQDMGFNIQVGAKTKKVKR